MSIQKSNQTSAEKTEAVIDFLLDSLEAQFLEMGEKVVVSKLFRQIGEKDDFAKKLESLLSHPIDNLSEVSDRISEQLKSLINYKIYSELMAFKTNISALWLLKNTGDSLHYIISLKRNEFEIRDSILDIVTDYNHKPIAARHKVSFQFIDSKSEKGLVGDSLIPINESIPKQS